MTEDDVDSEDDTVTVNVPAAKDTSVHTQGATSIGPENEQTHNQRHRFKLADMLIKLIFQMEITTADGPSVLELLAAEWSNNKIYYQNTTRGLYEASDAAFLEWLKLQKAVIDFKACKPPTSPMTLAEKAQCLLAKNRLSAQHARWTGLTYQVHGRTLEGVQALSLMLGNVVMMSDVDSLVMLEDGLRNMEKGIIGLLKG